MMHYRCNILSVFYCLYFKYFILFDRLTVYDLLKKHTIDNSYNTKLGIFEIQPVYNNGLCNVLLPLLCSVI